MSIAWFIVITMIVVGSQILIYYYFSLTGVEYNREFSQTVVFEGDEIEMTDEISNKKILPLPWLRLETRLHPDLKFEKHKDNLAGDNELHRALYSFTPYQRVRRTQYFTCSKRGHYEFSNVHLSSGDPFGFVTARKHLQVKGEITVYPKLIDIKDFPVPSQSWLGDVSVRRWIVEDPFVAAGVREYQSGDALNTVNWNATARTDQLQVTQNDYSADHNVMIYLNFNQTDDVWRPVIDRDLAEKSISYAATMATYIVEKGLNVGFGCNSYIGAKTRNRIRIEPDSSKPHLNFLLDTMSKLAVDANKLITTFLKEDIDARMTGEDILLITATVSDELKASIAKLEALDNHVEILYLDSEALQEFQFARGK